MHTKTAILVLAGAMSMLTLATLGLRAGPAAAMPATGSAAGPPFTRLKSFTTQTATLREVVDAGPYLYARVDFHGESHWVASLHRDLTVGSELQVTIVGRRETFHSRRLDRAFAPLLFGVLRTGASSPPSSSALASMENLR